MSCSQPLLDAAGGRGGHRLRALIVVLWRAGRRIQEALSLTEPDLDPRRGSVRVRYGTNDRRSEVRMEPGPGQRSSPGSPTA